MADFRIRARMLRLLEGNIRSDDLIILFLYARDHCDNRQIVADMGSFAAHLGGRDRGPTTKFVQDQANNFIFVMQMFEPGTRDKYTLENLPSSTKNFLPSALNNLEREPAAFASFTRQTGLRVTEARRVVASLVGRLKLKDDGNYAMPDDASQHEIKLMTYLAHALNIATPIDADKFVSEFYETMRSNSILSKSEIASSGKALRETIKLFSVSIMHGTEIKINDKITLQLEAGNHDEILQVFAGYQPEGKGRAMFPVLTTGLDSSKYCDPEIFSEGMPDQLIEINNENKLVRASSPSQHR